MIQTGAILLALVLVPMLALTLWIWVGESTARCVRLLVNRLMQR